MTTGQLARAIVAICARTETMTSDELEDLMEVIERIAGGGEILTAIAFVDHQRQLAEEPGE